MSRLINPDAIVGVFPKFKLSAWRISYKEKFLWRKEGFYHKFVGDAEFITKEKELEYNDLIFDYENKECYYKPHLIIDFCDGSRREKYFESKSLLNAWVVKNIPKKFIDWDE